MIKIIYLEYKSIIAMTSEATFKDQDNLYFLEHFKLSSK